MTLSTHVIFSHEEMSLLREALSSFRELPVERHWDGAMATHLMERASCSRGTLDSMLSLLTELSSIQSSDLQGETIDFLTKALSLLDRCEG